MGGEIFNLFGAGFLMFCMALSYFVAPMVGYEGIYGQTFIAGIACIVLDLAARLPSMRFWEGSAGGILLYLPLWVIGGIMAGYAHYVLAF